MLHKTEPGSQCKVNILVPVVLVKHYIQFITRLVYSPFSFSQKDFQNTILGYNKIVILCTYIQQSVIHFTLFIIVYLFSR